MTARPVRFVVKYFAVLSSAVGVASRGNEAVAKNVVTILATKNRFTADSLGSLKKRRVAAYARVSTDHEEQQSSYEAQVDYYTNYISGRKDWEFVSVYAEM